MKTIFRAAGFLLMAFSVLAFTAVIRLHNPHLQRESDGVWLCGATDFHDGHYWAEECMRIVPP